MPIGIVADNDFQRELDSLSSKKVVPSVEPKVEILEKESHPLAPLVKNESHGRNEGDMNVPDSLRKIIGETAVIDGRQAALGLAGMFGISASSVSAYAKGSTSTSSYNEPKRDIVSHINHSRARAIKRASKTLNSALGSITQDKLDYSDAKDLSTIAKDMSVVIKNLEPQSIPSNGTSEAASPQYVIFAPTFRDERTFESITVNE